MKLPNTLEDAIAQSVTATQAALEAGERRLLIEFQFPELKVMPVAQQFLQQCPSLGDRVKIFFADAGSAALARRDWPDIPYSLMGIKEPLDPVQPEDEAFVMIAPTPVEVETVEQVCTEAGDRPCILLNPKFQDVAVVGIGSAGRQLRERFLSTLNTVYFVRPLEKGALYHAYPDNWQVWWEGESGDYEPIADSAERPSGEALDAIIAQQNPSQPKPGLLASMQQFLRALSQ